ncbi:unnamed protein product [Linum trigynum]|uniref:Uncharacterized protein n=1 Tax=Linum trigynum TaxID=586398 RepID=A0AAV2FUP2_9ROSI
MYRWACDRLNEEPSFDAFRLIYKSRDSTNCWSIGRRDGAVGLVTGMPKLDSPWYKEYFFARPSWKWCSGDVEQPTGYVVGSKEAWCASSQFPRSVKDHVDCLVEGFQLRVTHSGPKRAYQHVRGFYGLKELANANRPKGKKRGTAVARTGVASSSAAMVTRGAGKRPLEPSGLHGDAKRPKAGLAQGRVGEARGKTAHQSDQPNPITLSPLAATDTEAAELAFHTVSDQLAMPSEYTSTSQGCNRRIAGIASQFFFSAQIGFSQIIMLNDRLSKTVDENTVEIAKLKKSLAEGRSALIEELRPELERGFEEHLPKKREKLSAEKEAHVAVESERDSMQRKLHQAEEIGRTLLEE